MESLVALSCPECNGQLEIREGTRVVICPYCHTPSILRGERGEFRYQVPAKCTREQALRTVHQFLSDVNGAFGLSRKAVVSELGLVHLPLWAVSATVMAWAFGKVAEPRGLTQWDEFPAKVHRVDRMTWIHTASDAMEFGLKEICLEGRPLEALDPEAAHEAGMVFEPDGNAADACRRAEISFEARVRKESKLHRVRSLCTRFIRQRISLVYYPLWIARISLRGRAYQVVVDGFSGKVKYATAPGRPPFYRAGALVLGMALGALLIACPAALPSYLNLARAALAGMGALVGVVLFQRAYVEYRHGGEIEYGTLGRVSQPMFWPTESPMNLLPRRRRSWEERAG